ncbi:MAG: 16S rRNA (guanine(527)-N(7))-methyltransferase RsmG [Bernardetiaceae bacterium]|nr:16S rRNA (guanine(527)-N(7))-methyltransferase RsmG [Bernardetiaceae bacterium]
MIEVSLIYKYFPNLSEQQQQQFAALYKLYDDWNSKINVISRKDMANFYERHVLHSLAIAQIVDFEAGDKILDVGTGGGFPGIPLAILYPEADFMLVDSIAKKIKVVEAVTEALALKNVKYQQTRVENLEDSYNFVLARAVTEIQKFYPWVRKRIIKKPRATTESDFRNGILYLKGGDLKEEFKDFKHHVRFYPIQDFFEEEFFDTKKVVYIPF